MMNLKQFTADDDTILKHLERCLVLYHGNADVERGFSINENCLVEHLMEDSLIAQRSIISAVSAIEGGIENVVIDKSLILSVRHASHKRKDALESRKERKTIEEIAARDDAIRLKSLTEQKKRLLEVAKEEADSLSKEIEVLKKRQKLN